MFLKTIANKKKHFHKYTMMKGIKLIIFSLFLSCFGDVSMAKPAKKIQRTFGMIKPSGMKYEAEIKSFIASNSLEMRWSKKIVMTSDKLDKLYWMHIGKPFYEEMKSTIVGKEVIVFILYGENAVEKYRSVIKEIRARYAINKTENAVHGSDSIDLARSEINLFFFCDKTSCR